MLIPLWFLRDLMVAVLLAPVLCWLIKKTKGVIVWLLGMMYLLKVQSFIPDMTIAALFFFSIGTCYSISKKGFAESALSKLKWTLPLWIVLMCVCVYFDGSNTDTGLMFYTPMVLTGVFAFIGCMARWGLDSRIYKNKVMAYAANNTFFIYVAHGFFGLFIARMIVGRLPFPAVVTYLITPFVAIAICLAVLWCMKRFLPKLTAIMIGER